mmetsp:Transcript_12001/g.29137  ORF Transcript_12001/g.29137 Transcript_12001/m.29137 type:complete len:243 (+) Transcript_12001:51-779(+)
MSVGFLRRLSEALPLTEAAPKATLLELEQQRKARELRSKNVQWALEKSFERAKSAEDHKGMWSCATNMAVSYEKAGDHPSAESWHRKALYIARRYELPQKQAVTMGQLGGLETRAGDFERALAMHQEHLRLAKKCGDLQETGEAYRCLAACHAALGNGDMAEKLDESHLIIALPEAQWEIPDGGNGVVRGQFGTTSLGKMLMAPTISAPPITGVGVGGPECVRSQQRTGGMPAILGRLVRRR